MDDLGESESNVDYGGGGGFGSLFSSGTEGDALLDALYEQVQEILDMRGETPKGTLRLLKIFLACSSLISVCLGTA